MERGITGRADGQVDGSKSVALNGIEPFHPQDIGVQQLLKNAAGT